MLALTRQARLFEISRAMSTELAQNIAGLQSGASVQVASSDFLGVRDAPLNILQLLFYIIMGHWGFPLISWDFMGCQRFELGVLKMRHTTD